MKSMLLCLGVLVALSSVLLGILAGEPAYARSDCSLTGDLALRLS